MYLTSPLPKEKKERSNSPINPPHKRVRSQEPHGARQQAIDSARQKAVGEEQEAGDEALDVEFGEVEPDAVEEDP